MDIEATKLYYKQIAATDLCDCDYCKNYISEIKIAYPKLENYLTSLGVDIEKPFETMPLEPDEAGYIEYIGAQYIVLGSMGDFTDQAINGVKIYLTESHPSTGIFEEHFVVEIGPINLKWVM